MKLKIDIPKEFEEHFDSDQFEDSLRRLSADAHLIAGNYEQELAVMLIKAFREAEPVRHGYWLGHNGEPCNRDDLGYVISAYCSECGEWLTGSDEMCCHSNFCPHCGAKMDMEDNDETD